MATLPRFVFPRNPAVTPGPINQKIITAPLFERADNAFVNVSTITPFPVRSYSAFSMFGEVLTTERTPIFELNSAYGTSVLRDTKVEENGAVIDDINSGVTTGEIRLRTGTNAAGRAVLNAGEVGRYLAGLGAEIGEGIRLSRPLVGDEVVRAGGRTPDGNEGIYFRFTAGDVSIVRLRNGIENPLPSADWNVDPLDGTGPSGYELDAENGIIVQVDYSWYGYGQIAYGVIGTPTGGRQQEFIVCHVINNQDFTGTSLRSPNLRVFAEADNNGATNSFDLFIGGRQFSVLGKVKPVNRFAGELRYEATVSTALYPLVTFRRKTGYENRSLKVDSYNINGDGDIRIAVIVGGSINSTNFLTPTHHSASETAVEVCTDATAFNTIGESIWDDFLLGANKTDSVPEDLRYDIPESDLITLAAVRLGTNNVTTTGMLRMREEW